MYSTYDFCLHQVRVTDTLFKWGKPWHTSWHNEWKTARVFYQYSNFHVLTDKNSRLSTDDCLAKTRSYIY